MRLDLDRLPTGSLATDERVTAAVLLPVIEREDGSYLVFTERAPDVPDHAGEMSFPGGRREEGDENALDIALRESSEEIGLDRAAAEPVGRLYDIDAPTGDRVRPFVARVPDTSYVPEPGEVDEIHVLSAQDLTHPTTYSAEPYPGMEGPAETLPYFRVDGVVVWGMTGYLLGRLLEETAGWETPESQPLEHPGATGPSR